FLLMLMFSISLVDFHTPADTRVLSPVFAVWVVLAACVLSAGMRRLPSHRASAVAAASIAVAACVFAWPTTKLVARLYREGDGFAHKQWQDSPTLAAVKQLPSDQQIFTNAPGAVYLVTGRQIILTVPSPISASSRLPNPEYPQL